MTLGGIKRRLQRCLFRPVQMQGGDLMNFFCFTGPFIVKRVKRSQVDAVSTGDGVFILEVADFCHQSSLFFCAGLPVSCKRFRKASCCDQKAVHQPFPVGKNVSGIRQWCDPQGFKAAGGGVG